MLRIDKTVISLDLIISRFSCDLEKCKGACCVSGDSGAPLEEEEAAILDSVFPLLKPFLREESLKTIGEQGTSVIDVENERVTPLNNGKECAYAVFESGIARCAIETAYNQGVISFRKPVSCYLYPVRIKKYRDFDAVNYDRWEICKPAIDKGVRMNTRVYRFTEGALRQKYGEKWFNLLETAARNLTVHKNDQ